MLTTLCSRNLIVLSFLHDDRCALQEPLPKTLMEVMEKKKSRFDKVKVGKTAEEIFHESAGWKSLETSSKVSGIERKKKIFFILLFCLSFPKRCLCANRACLVSCIMLMYVRR